MPAQAIASPVRDRILDAAERTVCAEGGANLTLDAVAQAAGVSKGGLLYHFPSKDALLAAMIERTCDAVDLRSDARRRSLPADDRAADMKAWVLGVVHPDRLQPEVGAALFAAAANNPALLDGVRRRYAEHIGRLTGTNDNFALGAVIMLAVDGLMLGEVWRLLPYTPEQREQIVQQLLRLADEASGPAAAGGRQP